jgi:archaellin
VKLAIAGAPIDMTPCDGSASPTNKTVISLTTKSDYLNNIEWTKTAIGQDNGNNILDPGEQFEITIDTTSLGTGNSLSQTLGANDSFSLQVKPSIGASVTIARQLPPSIDPVMDLH